MIYGEALALANPNRHHALVMADSMTRVKQNKPKNKQALIGNFGYHSLPTDLVTRGVCQV